MTPELLVSAERPLVSRPSLPTIQGLSGASLLEPDPSEPRFLVSTVTEASNVASQTTPTLFRRNKRLRHLDLDLGFLARAHANFLGGLLDPSRPVQLNVQGVREFLSPYPC